MNATNRKVLIPLVTMAVAAAVAIGSGATWTSESESSVAVTSGNILHANNHDGATLTIANLKPGDSASGSLTISNTGSLDSKLSVAETGTPTNTFFETAGGVNDLQLVIDRDGTTVYSGNFGDFAASGTTDITGTDTLMAANTGDTDDTVITFTVSLDPNADAASQSQSAGASYSFVTSPLEGETGILGLWG